MPYKLRKSPGKNLFWVVTKSTGRKHSRNPLPRKRAEAQMRALYAVESGYILTNRGKSKSRKPSSGRSKSPSRRKRM